MRKRKLETLKIIREVQLSAIAYMQKTGSSNKKEIYEAVIMKQYQIGYYTFLDYMKDTNVPEQIAEYEQKTT